MLDKIALNTKLKVNQNLIDDLFSKKILRYNPYKDGFSRQYYFGNKPEKSPYFISSGRSTRFNMSGVQTRLEVNPKHFSSYQNLINFLQQALLHYDPHQLLLTRLDFKADVPIPFSSVLQQAYRPGVHSFIGFFSEKGVISELVLGINPKAKIYDALERHGQAYSQRPLAAPQAASNPPLQGLTRFEVSLIPKGSIRLPIASFAELPDLLNFNPFTFYKFAKVRVPAANLSNSDHIKADHLLRIARDSKFGGMQMAKSYARHHFSKRRQKDFDQFFEIVSPPNLFGIYQADLRTFLSSDSYQPQNIGGIFT